MLITCRKCGKRYKMPSKPLEQLPVAVQCKNCRTVIPVRETVRKAIAKKGEARKVTCQDCGKEYRMTIRNLPTHVETTQCKACGGTIPLQNGNPKKVATSSTVAHLFSDASLKDTSDFDLSGLLTSGSGNLTHGDSSSAETLPLTDPLYVSEEYSGRSDSEAVQIDLEKIIRLIKVLVVGAIIIIVVGMSITHIRLYIQRKIAEREEIETTQRVEEQRLLSSSKTSQTPNKQKQNDGRNESSNIADESPDSKIDSNIPQ